MLPLFLIRLLPRVLVEKYANRVCARLVRVESDVKAIYLLLEGVEEGFSYTEGFRSHLLRRLDSANEERYALIMRLCDVENFRLSPEEGSNNPIL